MSKDLKTYPSTLETGIPGIEEIPQHWEIGRLKRICRLAYGETLVSDTRNDGEVPVFGSNGQVGFHSYANTKAPCIIIGRKGSFGKVNYSYEPVFAIDTTFYIDESNTEAHVPWLYFVLQWAGLDRVTKDSAIPGLDRQDAYEKVVAIPPLTEQTAIARFLDHFDQKVICYIQAKQKLLQLLEEQKQAIIHQAVTGQIDVRTGKPYPAYKSSGVEWFGDVPEHWSVIPLKYSIKCSSGDQLPSEQITADPPHSGYSPVIGGNGKLGYSTHTNVDSPLLVIGRVGALCGNVHYVSQPAWITDNALVLRVNQVDYELGYLTELLRIRNLNELANRSAQPVITGTQVGSLKIVKPPLHEQTLVFMYLKQLLSKTESVLSNVSRQIKLIQDLRNRMVSDVVTGKYDIRELSEILPK